MKPPNGWNEIVAFYTLPTRGPDGIVLPRWCSRNLTTFLAPFPLKLAWGGWTTHITCHNKIGDILIEVLDSVKQAGLAEYLAEDYGGCYMDRGIKGNPSHLSTHAFGAALDFRTKTNQQGTTGEPEMGQLVEPIFAKFGFVWGGEFSNPDPMHFQFASGY